MARSTRDTVDYFPHYINQGKTIFILEQKYGNDGYAFWFKLLELLASSDGHVFHCSNASDWLYLQAKTHLSEEIVCSILDTLCNLDAIDQQLWKEKVIWSQKLVDNLTPVYANRRRTAPTKPITTSRNTTTDELLQVEIPPDDAELDISTGQSTQRKKGSKVKKVNVEMNVNHYGSQHNVKLTQDEFNELVAEYPNDANDIVELLSLHIAEKGDKSTAQTHIFTIRKWVVDAVKQKKEKGWKGYEKQISLGALPQKEQSKYQTVNYESRSD